MAREPGTPTLIERLLAYAATAIIIVSVLSFFATLIIGMNDRYALANGLWPFVYGVSLWGLPLGFVCLIALFTVAHFRRAADNRATSSGKQPGRASASQRKAKRTAPGR